VKIFAGPLSESYRIAEENSLKCKYGFAVDAPPFDYDADCDIDAQDLHVFVTCISGPNVPVATNCLDKDLDHDGDVDQADFGRFQRCISGAGQMPIAPCMK
jgi:hypothetical protein